MSLRKRLLVISSATLLALSATPAYATSAPEPNPDTPSSQSAETELVPTSSDAQSNEQQVSATEDTTENTEPALAPRLKYAVAAGYDPFVFDRFGVNGPFHRNTENNVYFSETGIGLLTTEFLTTPVEFPVEWSEECTHILPDNTQVRSFSVQTGLNPYLTSDNDSETAGGYFLFIPKSFQNVTFMINDEVVDPYDPDASGISPAPSSGVDSLYRTPQNVEFYDVYWVHGWDSTLAIEGEIHVAAADWYGQEDVTLHYPIRIVPATLRCTSPEGNCEQALLPMIEGRDVYTDEQVEQHFAQSFGTWDFSEEQLQKIADAKSANNAKTTLIDDIYQPLPDLSDPTQPIAPLTIKTDPHGFGWLYAQTFELQNNFDVVYTFTESFSDTMSQVVLSVPVTYIPEGVCPYASKENPPTTPPTQNPPAQNPPKPDSVLAKTGVDITGVGIATALLLGLGGTALAARRRFGMQS
ncbi:MAG: hypothetical protein GX483_03330 [Actinomycetaceae bacterium]|nr:hypothetical protein [Actinomycetaceae bacterium]